MADKSELNSKMKRVVQMKPNKDYVNPGEEDQMEVQGYVSSTWRQCVTWFFIVLTVGLLRLLFHWLPHWFLRCTHRKCSVAAAKAILLKDQYTQWFVENVVTATNDGSRKWVTEPFTPFQCCQSTTGPIDEKPPTEDLSFPLVTASVSRRCC